MDYKKIIADKIIVDGVDSLEIENMITPITDSKMGDLCLPCFKFSKALKKSPQVIANDLVAIFSDVKDFEKVEAVNGYLNFFIEKKEFVKTAIDSCLKKGDIFKRFPKNNKKVCIDYSSINIAKPFHIGHLMSTAIGGSLYRIYQYLGYDVIGINHLGDWGTQFGKLLYAYKTWGKKEDIQKGGVKALLDLYVKFHKEAEENDDLNDEGRKWFKKIEDKEPDATEIFEWFKDITIKEVSRIYKRLDITFDSYNGESFYNDKMQPIIDTLQQKTLLTESEGAKVVDLSDYNMSPCLILRSDGASLYATRDLAAAVYRKNEYDFYKNLYVVAYQQNLHFNQVFKVLELMGYDWAKQCEHVQFGMVSLEGGGSLSTRKGNVLLLEEVLDEAVSKTKEIIENKNPNLPDKDKVAEDVGVGAVVFMALSTSRIKDISFSYEKALNFDGETAPYLQYTHARCVSILEKAGKIQFKKLDYSKITDDVSFSISKLIEKYDEVVLAACEKNEPSLLTRYLIDVAQEFNRFYVAEKIVGNIERLAICNCVKNILCNGLDLILIKAPNKM